MRTSTDITPWRPPPPHLCLRGSVGLHADRQCVIPDVWPVPLLRHKPDGDRELLRQPVRLQRWAPPLSFLTHNPPLLSSVASSTCCFSPPPAAPDRSSGVLQAVLLTLSMCLVLLALLLLMTWLRRTGQDGRRKKRKEEEEECYNEIRYTPSLMKRSFV